MNDGVGVGQMCLGVVYEDQVGYGGSKVFMLEIKFRYLTRKARPKLFYSSASRSPELPLIVHRPSQPIL